MQCFLRFLGLPSIACCRYDLDFWAHLGDYYYEYGISDGSNDVRWEAPPQGAIPLLHSAYILSRLAQYIIITISVCPEQLPGA